MNIVHLFAPVLLYLSQGTEELYETLIVDFSYAHRLCFYL